MRSGEWIYRVGLALSGLSLAVVVAYIVLVQNNRSVQLEVNQRQQFINQSMQLGRINDSLVRLIAATAVSKNDDKLRELLTQNGITINAAGEPEKAPAPPPSGSSAISGH
jgi:hypothetical protein